MLRTMLEPEALRAEFGDDCPDNFEFAMEHDRGLVLLPVQWALIYKEPEMVRQELESAPSR